MTSTAQAWFMNPVFLTWLLACVAAQCTKIVLGVIRQRRFDFRWMLLTGGMPSTHAAGVAAITSAVGFHLGFDTPLFAVTLAFTIITLFDAQGVRRWSGRQAQILNRILEDMYFKRRIHEERLKELLGHTPVEVMVGVGLGIAMAWVMR